jgi:hypothetical protein
MVCFLRAYIRQAEARHVMQSAADRELHRQDRLLGHITDERPQRIVSRVEIRAVDADGAGCRGP